MTDRYTIDMSKVKYITLPSVSKDEDKQKVFARYGDSFVSEIALGGCMIVDMTMKTTSTDNKKDISGKLSGLVNTLNAKANFEGELDLKEYATLMNKEVTLSVTLLGSVLSGKMPNSMPELVEVIRNFPRMVALNPVPYCFYLKQHSTSSVGFTTANITKQINDMIATNFFLLKSMKDQILALMESAGNPELDIEQKTIESTYAMQKAVDAEMGKILSYMFKCKTNVLTTEKAPKLSVCVSNILTYS